MIKNAEVTRRNFVAGSMLGMAGLVGAGMIAGCAPKAQNENNEQLSDTGENAESAEPLLQADETTDADIVVVGGGMSGLSAAVSASATGKKVILLEANSNTGGNGHGTEGIFGCGSSMQKELGIEFTFEDVIKAECNFFNYRLDALAWKDLVDASAGNIDWLAEQGVKFDGVDNYRNMGHLDAFHWYAGGATEGYITPMTQKAESQGVEIMLDTRGRQLVTNEDGSIAGIIAELKDGSYLQVNAPAVILATGGYADNDEKLKEMGINPDKVSRKGFPCHEGDGLDMAVAAGGVDVRSQRCVMREPGTLGGEFESALGALGIHNGGPYLFVNQNGERFTDENCNAANSAYAANCILDQKRSFAIANQAVLDIVDATVPPIADPLSVAAEDGMQNGASIFKADTVEELAALMEVDADTLAASFDRYNELCKKGHDEDFGKDPEAMASLEEGPYWAFEHGLFYFSTIGAIKTNRKFEVVDADDNAIPGLWAVGTDGCGLYRDTYTVMMPASCMANNINSGRHAGEAAVAYCEA